MFKEITYPILFFKNDKLISYKIELAHFKNKNYTLLLIISKEKSEENFELRKVSIRIFNDIISNDSILVHDAWGYVQLNQIQTLIETFKKDSLDKFVEQLDRINNDLEDLNKEKYIIKTFCRDPGYIDFIFFIKEWLNDTTESPSNHSGLSTPSNTKSSP